ncbi:Melanoma-associated antigen G1 [Grifola frondosa]|uniref:Melanoma-associated antigen G1 n=1 Tax=Grifola frondosa TaxID=5627 RepID=A0A1C7M8X3_GRIFR|nr:Melanoma-associated antigen G1 [Grifola frondosa]
MARATRSRHQPSQSQPSARSSQLQRARRGRVEEEEDEEENDRQYNQDGDDDILNGGNGQNELERKANDLVRLALFTEHKRIPLRRDEISKKVLGSSSRSFNVVFAHAQETLRKTFGMELVELQTRNADKDINEKDAEMLKNTGLKKKATPSGTKTYILRSVLDPIIIERACAPNAEILAAEQADRIGDDDYADDDDSGVGTHSTGSIFAWHRSDQLASVGVLYVILALILVDGRVVSDNDLRTILKRLHLPSTANVPLSSQSTHQSLNIDAYLAQLVRQGYLDRQRVGNQKKGAAKRGRAPAASQAPTGEDGANVWEWRWGPCAMSEVGEKAIAQFVTEFMIERPSAEDEEDNEEGAAVGEPDAAKKKQLQVILKGIERAAGGAPLADIR